MPMSLLFCYFVTLLFLLARKIVSFQSHLMFFLVFTVFNFQLFIILSLYFSFPFPYFKSRGSISDFLVVNVFGYISKAIISF